jgi:hypothetical protein
MVAFETMVEELNIEKVAPHVKYQLWPMEGICIGNI